MLISYNCNGNSNLQNLTNDVRPEMGDLSYHKSVPLSLQHIITTAVFQGSTIVDKSDTLAAVGRSLLPFSCTVGGGLI